MIKFFIENELISSNDSSFQLLSISHNIYKSFDCGYEVRRIILDVSKIFDKAWHDGIIIKLEENGISGKLHKLLHNFLANGKQRVVLNGQVSSWANVKAGVPQGFITLSYLYQ